VPARHLTEKRHALLHGVFLWLAQHGRTPGAGGYSNYPKGSPSNCTTPLCEKIITFNRTRQTIPNQVSDMSYKIAGIPGDGIGYVVMDECLLVLDAAVGGFNLVLKFDGCDWCLDYFLRNGGMMPVGWKDVIGQHDAILFRAVGAPDRVPDYIAVWDSLITI